MKIEIQSQAIIYSTFLALSGAGPKLLPPLVPGIIEVSKSQIPPIIGTKTNKDSQPEQLKSCNLFILNKKRLAVKITPGISKTEEYKALR